MHFATIHKTLSGCKNVFRLIEGENLIAVTFLCCIVTHMQKVVTHNGSFHPDDVLAVATVTLYLGEGNYDLVRTRDLDIIEKADWVLDVGGECDPDKRRFDHHQASVIGRENGIPYSSFGLVWNEIGEKLCGSKEVARGIERSLVLPIDAADNQMTICTPVHEGLTPFAFYDVISTFEPAWESEENYFVGFCRAVSFARRLLRRMIAQGKALEDMRLLIRETYEEAEDKKMLVFDKPIYRAEVADYKDVKIFVSPVLGYGESNNNWMVVSVPKKNGSLSNRAVFPEEWGGLADEELEKISGVKGAVFCHKELYILIAKTKEAALEAASRFTSS